MSNPLLDDIEKRLKDAIVAGKATIGRSVLRELHLLDLPGWVIPQADFELSEPLLNRVPEILSLTGMCTVEPIGAVRLGIEITQVQDQLTAKTISTFEPVFSFRDFVQHVGLGGIQALSTLLESASINTFRFARSDGERTRLDLSLSSEHRLRIGPLELSLNLTGAELELHPLKLLTIGGQLRGNGLVLQLRMPAEGDLKCELEPGGLTLAQFIESLGITLPPLPPLPLLNQKLESLWIQPMGTVRIGGRVPWPRVGSVLLSLVGIDDQLGFVTLSRYTAIPLVYSYAPGIRFLSRTVRARLITS